MRIKTFFVSVVFCVAWVFPIQVLAAPFTDTIAWDAEGQAQPGNNIGFAHSVAATGADGSTILFGYAGGRLYISTDYGVTFEEIQPLGDADGDWYTVAMDDDGSHIIAAEQTGRVYVSTNGGSSWAETQPAGDVDLDWQAVAMDGDGTHIIIVATAGRVYLSSTSGSSWAETQPAGDFDLDWWSVALDDDGSVMLAGINGGRLYLSTNGGSSWAETQPAGDDDFSWLGLASDADGSNLVAAPNGDGSIYLSTNSGSSWTGTQPAGLGTFAWSAVASDDDGSHLVAAIDDTRASGGRMYSTSDGGSSWSETRPNGDADAHWLRVVLDSDGSHILAIREVISIFTSEVLHFGLAVPYIESTTPTDGAEDVATTQNILLGFPAAVSANAGDIVIYDASDDSVVETIDVTSGAVTGSGTDTITVNPTANLDEETSYYVLIDAGAFTDDTTGFEFVGLDEPSALQFTTADETSPSVVSFSPQNGAENVNTGTRLAISFDEAVVVGSGSITIRQTDDDSIFDTIDVTSENVTISGTTVTVRLGNVLDDETTYAVRIPATAFEDASGNAYAGISDNATWAFTTDEGETQTSQRSGRSSSDARNQSGTSEDENASGTEELLGRLRELIEQVIALGGDVPDAALFLLEGAPAYERDLTIDSEGDDVQRLQEFLIAQNTGPAAQALSTFGATGYFGPLTQAALAEYQASVGIEPAVGYFGPTTRAYVNSL